MRSIIAALRTLVLPNGQTSGQRIVLDGVNGVITVYNAANFPIATISSTTGFQTQAAAGQFAELSPQGVVRVGSSDWDTPASFSTGPALPIGVSTFLASAKNNLGPYNATVGIALNPGDQSGATPAKVALITPGETTPVNFEIDGVDQGRGLVAHAARDTNAPGVTTTETVAITTASIKFETGRAYRIRIKGVVNSNTVGDCVMVRVRKTNASGQLFIDSFSGLRINAGGDNTLFDYENIIRNDTGAAVTAPLALTYVRIVGSGTVAIVANDINPAYIHVTDIGASGSFPFANEIV